LPAEPKLHIVDVPLNDQTALSSSKIAFSLDPTTPTPTPVSPSKTNANFSQQPQVSPRQPYMVGPLPSQTKRQLLFEDEMSIERLQAAPSSHLKVVAF
jgi:replication factor A1